jgi:Protein of unknown function (DUF2924)
MRQFQRPSINPEHRRIIHKTSAPKIAPGTRFIREWQNQVHLVNVEAKGYEYRGVRYRSLSEIARRITGTRWSGPLFFGVQTACSATHFVRGYLHSEP